MKKKIEVLKLIEKKRGTIYNCQILEIVQVLFFTFLSVYLNRKKSFFRIHNFLVKKSRLVEVFCLSLPAYLNSLSIQIDYSNAILGKKSFPFNLKYQSDHE